MDDLNFSHATYRASGALTFPFIALLAVSLLTLGGCAGLTGDLQSWLGSSSDSETETEADSTSESEPVAESEPINQSAAAEPGSVDDLEVNVGDRVFFATDKSNLDSAAQETLRRQAAWLERYPQIIVRIEGHADERGTREYNLALSQRRANETREFLVGLGIAGNRISIIPYGKERPLALCSNENCWKQNRRAVTTVVAPGS